jgi:hypothetical protein
MLKRILILGGLLAMLWVVAACGSENGGDAEEADNPSTGSTGVTLDADFADALPVPSQLAIGTFLLEETDKAVTVEQAGELLPNYQMLQALQSSGTAAQVELDTVLKQIQGAMTDEQLTEIKEMQLTPDNMFELMQERGGFGGDHGGPGGPGGGGFRPPAGMTFGGGGGGMGGMGGGGFGGNQNLSPEEQEAAFAEQMNTVMGSAMTGLLISLLEARAEGETWEVAATDQNFILQRQVLGAISEAAGLDQQEIFAQARDGGTLLEIAEANGVDMDELLALVIHAETERVNQSVADGSMEQADADEWLAGLEAQIKELLEETFEFGGGRGAPGRNTREP